MLVAALLALFAGCASAPVAPPKAPTLDGLRAAAAANTEGAKAWRNLALAELFSAGGDSAAAEKALAHAQHLDPKSPELVYASALLHDVHGQPAAALDGYLEAIELAQASRSADAQAIVEAAAYGVVGGSGMVRAYPERVGPRIERVLARPGSSLAARAALLEIVEPLAQRKGDLEQARRLATAVGCPSDYRVAGPFGPRDLLGFDGPPPVNPGAPLGARYDLGGVRGVRPTRSLQAQGCRLQLGGGPVAEGGTTMVEAALHIARAGDYVVRVDTPNSVELFVDGKSALRVDRRKVLGARVVFAKLPLSAGMHRVMLRVTSRHPNPVLQFAVAAYKPADAEALQPPAPSAAPTGFDLYLRVAVALARGDVLLAREALAKPADAYGASALLLTQRAAVALADPLLPDGVRGDEARRYLAAAMGRDPALWAPVLQMASLAAKAGRAKEAIAALRKAVAHWPQVPVIGLSLVQLLRSKGFYAAADRALSHVREVVPDACTPMNAQLASLRRRERMRDAYALAKQLVACDAESNALLTFQLERRDFAAAKRELARLRALEPTSSLYSTLLSEISLAKNMHDPAWLKSATAELRRRYPRAYSGAIEQIDDLAAAGHDSAALAALHEAVQREPASMVGLYRVAQGLGEPHVLQAYRRDGLAAIKAFEASGRKYDGPQVLVLDYMATRVFWDGSSLDLVHTVQKAQSDEAVDQLAEVDIPDGAQVLTLRAIKPDGRVLEADNIANKSSVSLPSVAPGDYVEFEYLQANSPADGFPRGYLGERFYFKSFEVPFHHSEMVVLLPKDMPYELDPRGAAPVVTEKLVGGLRVLDFAVDQSVPLVEEPNSVSAREFIPSIRVGVKATFPSMIESLRDVLVDRDLYDPYYARLARQIVGDAAPNDYTLRAQRLYAWVLEHIENNNDVFSQAALMLRAKSGNRARVLHYLLGLAHVPSQLALGHNFSGDATDSRMADADTYDHLLVRVGVSGKPVWLYANERWAPFGFVPAFLRGQPALLLTPGAPRVRISQGLLGEDTRRFVVNAQLKPSGAARVDVTETLHGSEAVAWRGQLEQIPQAELEHRMEQDYVARLFPGAALVSLDITGRAQGDPDLVLHYVADVQTFARKVSSGLALPALLPSEISSNYARTASRKTTELVSSPVHTEVSVSVALPHGFRLASTSAPEALRGAFAGRPTFKNEVRADAQGVHVQRVLRVAMQRIAPKDYPAFAEFCRRVDEVEGRELLLTH